MFSTVAFFLLIPLMSIQYERMFSNTAIRVVRAANAIARKNSVAHNTPPVIFANTFGSVMNNRLGPLPASIPKAEHAGKMMKPESSAIDVSRHTILMLSPVRDLSSLK